MRLGAAQLAGDLVQDEQLPLWFHSIPPSDGVRRMEALASTNLTKEALDESAGGSTLLEEGFAHREEGSRPCFGMGNWR